MTAELIRLEVGPVAHGGHCVARHEGRVVFVRHALPGEIVRARLTDAGADAKFWRADAVEVLTASPDRTPAPCRLAGPGRCGGCDWQHATLPAQRQLKAAVIIEQLVRLARLHPGQDGVPEVVVEEVPLLPAEAAAGAEPGEAFDGLGWRTRVRFGVDAAGRVGLRRHRSHDLIPVKECLIADRRIDELDLAGRSWRGVSGVEVVLPAGDEPALVVLEPSGASPLKPPRLPDSVSLASRDGAVLTRLRGRTWVSEQVTIEGQERRFRVTGTGFWQVHPRAAQVLLDAVLAAAAARPGERALDLYAGAGLFAAGLAAQVGVTGSVIAVESDPRAVADARRSLHSEPCVRFETGAVEPVLARLAVEASGAPGRADVVVLDPPRTGAGAAVIRRILALEPRVVVYVACDPAALARDLATAAGLGYRLAGLRAFDLFPMTHHVECVATLVPVVPATATAATAPVPSPDPELS